MSENTLIENPTRLLKTSPESLSGIEGFIDYDIGIKAWTKKAEELINRFGDDVIIEESTLAKIGEKPRVTFGAYSNFAGVAKTASGLYLFNLPEEDTYINLVKTIGEEPISGIVGTNPNHIKRGAIDQFLQRENFKYLMPKDISLGGFNILINPREKEILFAAGFFNPTTL